MTIHQVRGIILLFVIILCAMIYAVATAKPGNPELEQAQIAYQIEKWQLKREILHRDAMLVFYGTIGVLTSLCLSFLIVAGGIARAKNKAASVFTAHIGQHSSIPVHYSDLHQCYSIALNLSLAEIEASINTAQDQAYQISRQPLFSTPAFAELLRTGTVAPGKPLLIGFSHNSPLEGGRGVSPQYRDLRDLKSVAVAGWQGSGKTRSMAYLIAASVIAEGVRVFVIDPHKNHAEGLYALIQPLEKTGRVTVINPFDTPALIQHVNHILDRRLAGQETNEPGILLVIDELNRLARHECFDELIKFLERCTEETRKANITFIGGSHKWTARHFKGRADLRSCMNSMLIHKTKPSQADLLLEDAQDKQLVKQLQHPGDAILVTDYAPPVIVSMPLCTRQDMETIVAQINRTTDRITLTQSTKSPPGRACPEPCHPERSRRVVEGGEGWVKSPLEGGQGGVKHPNDDYRATPQKPAKHSQPNLSKESSEIIPLARHRKYPSDPTQLTVELIKEQIRLRKQQQPGLTQAAIARQAGLSPGVLSNILNNWRSLKPAEKRKLYEVLFAHTTQKHVIA